MLYIYPLIRLLLIILYSCRHQTCALAMTSSVHTAVLQVTKEMTRRLRAPASKPPWKNPNGIPRNPATIW